MASEYILKARYSTRTSRVWVEQNIIIAETFSGIVMDASDAREDLAMMSKLTRFIDTSHPYGLIVDISGLESVSKEAVDILIEAGKKEDSQAVTIAFVVKSKLAKIIGNFIMGFKSMKKDKKIFNNIDEAKIWTKNRLLSKN